jgi:uncharacterized protein (TIGR02444 family)
MRSPRPDLEAESWAFALALYARPGVANACLILQNEADVDVMLVLMVTFAAVKRRTLLTPDEIGALDEACRPWREQIVRNLRTIRTVLKTGPQPAPSDEAEQLRSRVKALELEAERLENKLLAECLPLRPPGQEAVRPEQLRTVLNEVVMRFADQRGTKTDASFSSPIDAIVGAAMQDAS